MVCTEANIILLKQCVMHYEIEDPKTGMSRTSLFYTYINIITIRYHYYKYNVCRSNLVRWYILPIYIHP